MSIINRISYLVTCGFVVVVILSACGSAPTIEGGQITVSPGTDISLNEQATLKIDVVVQGASPQFTWTADRGKLSNPSAPSVIYTAPDVAGPDVVTVVVTAGKTTFTQTTTFNVVEPPPSPPTEAPLPADTPTPTPSPEPIRCNLPAVTPFLFSQLATVNGQYAMYGPLTEQNLICEAVYDIVHTPGTMAVHVKYENVGPNFAWWGVATPNGYDASKYSQLCFWAYAEKPAQSFRVKMKDTAKTPKSENGIVTTIGVTKQWTQICTNISVFSDLGVQVDRMENINLGFEQPTGSAEIWIADFEFNT